MSENEEQELAEEATAADLEQAVDEATEAVRVQADALDELDGSATPEGAMGMAHLMDVPVRVTVEVGRAQLTLGQLVEQGAGSVLELDRAAHEPADILVNGKVVARGEIVTIGDSYGVRITEVS